MVFLTFLQTQLNDLINSNVSVINYNRLSEAVKKTIKNYSLLEIFYKPGKTKEKITKNQGKNTIPLRL